MAADRIVILGWPGAGKTTLAHRLAVDAAAAGQPTTVRHTDDLIATHDWSAASAEVAKWFDVPGPKIIEGVAAARALRKWREAHPGEPPPVDRVINLTHPHRPLDSRSVGMGKGCDKVLAELADWFSAHGVVIETAASLRAAAEEREILADLEEA
jgi:RecA/RadA recombinase